MIGVNFTGWGGPPVKGHGALVRPHPMGVDMGLWVEARLGAPCNRETSLVVGGVSGLAGVDVHAGDGSATTTPPVLRPRRSYRSYEFMLIVGHGVCVPHGVVVSGACDVARQGWWPESTLILRGDENAFR